MTSKDKILSGVVIVIFVAAGYVLYNGLFSDQINVVTNPAPDIEGNKKTIINLLPFGTTLDVDKLEARNIQNNLTPGSVFVYPTVTTADVGVPIEQLLLPKQ